jgi:hypothetical protein
VAKMATSAPTTPMTSASTPRVDWPTAGTLPEVLTQGRIRACWDLPILTIERLPPHFRQCFDFPLRGRAGRVNASAGRRRAGMTRAPCFGCVEHLPARWSWLG